ncbi:MAG: helix-turn-helix domain-containing protein [Acidimicrobiales bacterium]
MSSANVRPLAYSVPEAAAVAGVSRAHLYRAMRVGDLASVKTGSRRVILHDDLVAWLHGQREIAVGVDELADLADAREPATPPISRTRATRRPTRRTSRPSNAAQATLPLAD